MSALEQLINQPKHRKLAILLALLGSMTPLAGLHKFYLGQPLWGVVYLLLGWSTPIPRFACAIEAVWYMAQDGEQFHQRFNLGTTSAAIAQIIPFPTAQPGARVPTAPSTMAPQVEDISAALRELDCLRADGLVSEYEFEQKRRQLLDRIP